VAIAPDTTGSTSMTGGATSTSIDITAAAVGARVYVWIAIGPAPTGTINITGWTNVVTQTEDGTTARYALMTRVKQSGDTTFSVSWVNSAKGTLGWGSYTGQDAVTPDELASLTTNGVTSRTAVPTSSLTPTATGRWSLGFWSARTSTAGNKPITWTPDAALTERLDIDNNTAASAPWIGVEIADSNGTVTVAAHSYTASHNAAESHDATVLLFLIPASTTSTPPTSATTPRRDRRPTTIRRSRGFSPPLQVAPAPTNLITHPRYRPARITRARAFEPPKPITISNPAFAIQAAGTRIRPNKYLRRRRVFSPPIDQAVVPSTVRTRRWFKPRSRQTEFVVTPTQVVVPTNPAITFVVDIRIRAGRMLRRARIFTTPIDQPEPPTVTARRRWFKPRVRQTEFLTPPPQAVAATNPTITFTSLIRIRVGRMLRRARAFTPVPPQVVPPVNPTITFTSLIRIRVGRMIRRGRVAMPTPPQVVVTPTNPSITFVSLRRRLQVLLRKGRTFAPPIDQTGPPGAPTRRRFSILPKRSRVTRPVPSVEPPQAPKSPRRRFFGWLRRKPQAFKPSPPQVVVPNPNITFPVHPYRHYDKVFKHPRVFSPPLPQAIQKYPFVPDETITIQTGLHVTYVATQTVEIDISTGGGHEVATSIVVTNVQTA
jgi:hypothetical protein